MMTKNPSLTTVDWSTLPPPTDDGAAAHLVGMTMPELALVATDQRSVDLSALKGRSVLYAYPMTGRTDTPLPEGWDDIPGARGCTPQSCAFRDHAADLTALGVDHLFGLSTQDSAYQTEAAGRLHLPFPLLSDANLALIHALNLPTFKVDGQVLNKRLTLILKDNVIEHVFYPVFPPDRNASNVIAWLS